MARSSGSFVSLDTTVVLGTWSVSAQRCLHTVAQKLLLCSQLSVIHALSASVMHTRHIPTGYLSLCKTETDWCTILHMLQRPRGPCNVSNPTTPQRAPCPCCSCSHLYRFVIGYISHDAHVLCGARVYAVGLKVSTPGRAHARAVAHASCQHFRPHDH